MIVNEGLRESSSNRYWVSKKLIYNRGKNKTGSSTNESKEIKILKIDDNIINPSSFSEKTKTYFQ